MLLLPFGALVEYDAGELFLLLLAFGALVEYDAGEEPFGFLLLPFEVEPYVLVLPFVAGLGPYAGLPQAPPSL